MDELSIWRELYLLGQIVHESRPCSLPRTSGLPAPKAGFLMSPTGALLAAAREKQLYQLKQWKFLLNFSVVEEPILVTREPSKYSIFSGEDRLGFRAGICHASRVKAAVPKGTWQCY